MSMNKALNATIALIEGRTDIAKEILRDPTSDVRDVPAVLARLTRAVNTVAVKALRNSLVRTLSIQCPARNSEVASRVVVLDKDGTLIPEVDVVKILDETFFMGVSAIETVLDNIVDELECK